MAKYNKPESIKEVLDAQPKVRIMVPGTPGVKREKDYKEVIVNGYNYRIRCGEYVEVPQTVADILANSNETIRKSMDAFAEMSKGGGLNLSAEK